MKIKCLISTLLLSFNFVVALNLQNDIRVETRSNGATNINLPIKIHDKKFGEFFVTITFELNDQVLPQIQNALVKMFSLDSNGSSTFGHDAKKWMILYKDKPFESYPKKQLLINNQDQMKEIYGNYPLEAIYQDNK